MFKQVALPFFEMSQERSWIRNLVLVIGGSFLIALFARIAIPLSFSPVPVRRQTYNTLMLEFYVRKNLVVPIRQKRL